MKYNGSMTQAQPKDRATARGRGRPTRFPGKPNQHRLTVSLTPACRKRILSLSRKFNCSQSDVVELGIWQLHPFMATQDDT